MNAFWNFVGPLLGLGARPEELTFVQISLRGVVVFIATLIMVRLGHKRSLSRKTAFDAVLLVILASVLSRAINGSAAFFATLGGGLVLVLLHRLLAFIAFHSHWFGCLIKGRPELIIEDGDFVLNTMHRNHISTHDVEEDMRLSLHDDDVSKVKKGRVERGVLCCVCGAFSDKWLDVARRCGKNAEPLQVEWGKHIDQKNVDRELASGKFDTVTLIHNETSTGVTNPLPEICCTLAKYPDVALIVDTVSSFSAMKIDMDALGIDVMLTGAQKALALPPGFSLFSVSEKAFARAEKQKDRGYYFDFLEFKKQQAEWMTPSTPSIGHIFALQSKLDEIFEEGLQARFARHAHTNALVHDWMGRRGFEFFAEEDFRSITLTCVENNRGIDVPRLAS